MSLSTLVQDLGKKFLCNSEVTITANASFVPAPLSMDLSGCGFGKTGLIKNPGGLPPKIPPPVKQETGDGAANVSQR